MGRGLQEGDASKRLLGDVRALIEQARTRVAQAANSGLVMLYWSVGARIRQDLLRSRRADYGTKIVATLSPQLTREHGQGFSSANLFRMIQIAGRFPDSAIVVTLSRQLGWSHFLKLISGSTKAASALRNT